MKTTTSLLTCFVLGILCALIRVQAAHPASNGSSGRWLILPGGASGGAISSQTSEVDLIKQYGSENVVARDVGIGEGEIEKGTEMFPADPMRRLDILWKDPTRKISPKSIRISGAKSVWKTMHGVSLGTSLKQLEGFNQKPFRLTGFAFDYSGTVISWNEGALEQELGGVQSPGRVILRLDVQQSQAQRADYRSLLGDRVFSSGQPAMQVLNPTVYEIIWFMR
jgi:hypothetical protein